MNVITKKVQLPDGRTITIETGKVAKQADGAAVLRMGNTVLLATVCAAKDAVPGTDFMPALAGFAASAAMACSDIPFEHTISEVRVARIHGEYVINPTFQQMAEADMDLMVGATKDNIMMVEGEMNEVSEQELIEALKAAAEAIKPMCTLQDELSKELGKDVKR